MPFAPFVGVNHHGKSIVFAASLVSHEDTQTFVWVFNQWLKCMGKPPQGILTDQCKAIAKGVDLVFPGVPHRLCLWHLLQNASRNLGSLKNWKEIEKNMSTVVHDSLDPDEFDEAWKEMVDTHGLQNNSWITDTYNIRKRWAPGHWRSTFWAGMSSTQRSENINRFFKTFLSIETGLTQFAMQYEGALKQKVEEEKILNHQSTHRPRPVDKAAIVEYVFHKAYTTAKYKEVKEECDKVRHTNLRKIGKIGTLSLYKIDEKITKPIWRATRKTFDVSMDTVKGEFKCSCKLFEFKGTVLPRMSIHTYTCMPH